MTGKELWTVIENQAMALIPTYEVGYPGWDFEGQYLGDMEAVDHRFPGILHLIIDSELGISLRALLDIEQLESVVDWLGIGQPEESYATDMQHNIADFLGMTRDELRRMVETP